MTHELSVIVPIFNEYQTIPTLVEALSKQFAAYPGIRAEVIFVDDGSTDNSIEALAAALHHAYTPVLVKLSRNFGSHGALRAGMGIARGECITFLYADLQDPPELIFRLYEKCALGYDIVWARRQNSQSIFSQLYAWLMRQAVNPAFPREGFDVVMLRQKVRNVLVKHSEANSSLFLQILGIGFSQESILYRKASRKHGTSKWTFSKKIKLVIDSLIGYSYIPIRIVSLIGVVMTFLGIGWALYVILRLYFYNDVVQGWAATLSALMFGFGITNISLAMIAEYLWRTLDAARQRPAFIIDTMQELPRVE
jgi:glycosyltransferase involved in cell wall biosynthesis